MFGLNYIYVWERANVLDYGILVLFADVPEKSEPDCALSLLGRIVHVIVPQVFVYERSRMIELERKLFRVHETRERF